MDGRGLRESVESSAAAGSEAAAAESDVRVDVGTAADTSRPPAVRNLLRSMMSDRADVDALLAATTAHAAPPHVSIPSVADPSATPSADAGEETPMSPSVAAAISGAASPTPSAPATAGNPSIALPAPPRKGAEGGELIHAEDRDRGAVPAGIYYSYLSAFGAPAFNAMLLSLVFMTGVSLGTDVWLSAWSTGRGGFSLGVYLGSYAALTAGSALLSLSYSLSWARGGINAARTLHNNMLRCILRSPSAFGC